MKKSPLLNVVLVRNELRPGRQPRSLRLLSEGNAMKRNWKLVVCLLLAALTLCACSAQESPEDFPDITQALGPTVTPTQAPAAEPQLGDPMADGSVGGESIFSTNPYDVDISGLTDADIMSEENYIDPYEDQLLSAVVPQGTEYPYAGSTPIPLNPVDMPTPTPRPDLAFTYSTYIASTVGVTFQGPVSWMVDESYPSMMILSEPSNQIKDGQQCVITLSAEPVSSNYDQGDLKTHVNQRLDTLYISDYTDWKPSYTATRYMMGSEGVYANYTATRMDGVEIGGRIHYACIDNVLYGLEIVFPQGYKDDFIDVFGEIRSSMEMIR